MEDNCKRKRYNISKEERLREITHLQQLLQSLDDQIRLKHTRMNKALSVKDYKLCDTLSDERRALMREKDGIQKQLTALQKKESKAQWHQKRKHHGSSPDSAKLPLKRRKSHIDIMMKRNSGTESSTSTSSASGSTKAKSAVKGDDDDEETEGKDGPQSKILNEDEESKDSPSGTPATLILSDSNDEFSSTPKNLQIEVPSNL